jgi:hypothetical protein
MKVIDNSLVEYISGGRGGNTGDYRSERSSNRRNQGRGNDNRGYYSRNTSSGCINGMMVGAATGAFGGLLGVAVGTLGGALTGKCFDSRNEGGGNIGMGGSSNNCDDSRGTCSW